MIIDFFQDNVVCFRQIFRTFGAELFNESAMLVYPNAKINLGLHVTARRADGYHDIETVFYPIPLMDALEVKEISSITRFRQTGTPLDCAAEDNLVMQALHMIEAKYALPPIEVHLFKHIPSGAGLGGGSSDAAFMVRLLNEKFQLGMNADAMRQVVSTLGADCAFFIENSPMLATGIGDRLTPIDITLTGWTLLLVKPDIHVSTREAYAGITPHNPERPLSEILQLPVEQWQGTLHNDFEDSIFAAYPEIAAIRDRLLDLGATYAAMSGSGSAVFGLFREPIDHAEEKFADCFVRQRQL